MADTPSNPWGEPNPQGSPPPGPGPSGSPPAGGPPPQPGGSYPPPQGASYPPPQGGAKPPGYPPPQGASYPPPQGGAQPPGYPPQQGATWQGGGQGYPAAPPPMKKKRGAKPWILGCGGLFLLSALAIGGCAFLLRDSIGGVVDLALAEIEADEFLTEVDNEDYAAARTFAADGCPADGQIDTAEASALGGSFNGFSVSTDDDITPDQLTDLDEIDVTGTLRSLDGGRLPVALEMVKQGGDWKVCSFVF